MAAAVDDAGALLQGRALLEAANAVMMLGALAELDPWCSSPRPPPLCTLALNPEP